MPAGCRCGHTLPTVYALAVTTVVVPFAGPAGKSRLELPGRARRALALAMLGDVLAACVAVGRTRVATSDADGARIACEAGADAVGDPGGGQGPAVAAALDGLDPGGVLVVNADVPCIVSRDLRSLLAATPAGGIALVERLDAVSAPVPNIAEDVDTLDDLHRLQLRCGPRTQACLAELADGALR